MAVTGKAIKIEGSHVNADTAMGWYLGMDGLPKEEIAAKFMSGVDPDIAANVSAGDMLVCGRDFGYGKVHTSIFTAMEVLQVSCIIAESFATQMVQTGLMFGAVLVEVPGITDKVSMGDELEVDTAAAVVKNLTTGEIIVGKPFPPFLQEVMADGGQMRHLGKKIYMQKMAGSGAIMGIVSDYQKNLTRLFETIDGLTDDQMDWKLVLPLGDDYWSVRQILAHIEEVNLFWIDKLRRLIDDPANTPAERTEEELAVRSKAIDTAYDRDVKDIITGIKSSAETAVKNLMTLSEDELNINLNAALGVQVPISFLVKHVYPDHIEEHIKHIERQLFAYSQYH